jgi:uncharacterized protein YjiS (DUF1127 family)
MSETPYTFGAVRADARERPVGIASEAPVRPVRPLGRALDLLLTWIERYRQRRLLQAMSDHMLHDIGLSRADIDREIRKQFWRV